MKVKMLETKKGSPNGIIVNTYHEGEGYDLPPSLGRVFLENGWAESISKIVEVKLDGKKIKEAVDEFVDDNPSIEGPKEDNQESIEEEVTDDDNDEEEEEEKSNPNVGKKKIEELSSQELKKVCIEAGIKIDKNKKYSQKKMIDALKKRKIFYV